ncbi:hypothetical protein ACU686_28600 [Yinghuangia aomiensis]
MSLAGDDSAGRCPSSPPGRRTGTAAGSAAPCTTPTRGACSPPSSARSTNSEPGRVHRADTLGRLEIVADTFARMLDGVAWWISYVPPHGRSLRTVRYSVHRMTGSPNAARARYLRRRPPNTTWPPTRRRPRPCRAAASCSRRGIRATIRPKKTCCW